MSAPLGVVMAFALALSLPAIRAAEPDTRETEPAASEASDESDPSDSKPDNAVYGTLKLDPLQISVPAFRIPRTRPEGLKWELYLNLTLDFGWPLLSADYLLTPARVPQRKNHLAQTARLVEGDELDLAGIFPATAFSLTARNRLSSDRIFAGSLKLRGLNARVLLDGVPANDPFDGGIPQARLPYEALARAEVVPGGGATAWGNGTAGGVVQFFTLPPKGKMVWETYDPADGGPPDPKLKKQVIHPTTQLAATVGDYGTKGIEFVTSQPTSYGVLQVLGRGFQTDGFPLVATGSSGPVDLPAWNRHHWIEARWRQPLGKEVELLATISQYDESGGNGTAYQQDTSRGTFASVAIAANPRLGFVWNVLAYAQHGSSTSRFSVVNAARSAETPWLDRFAVPADAFGASWTAAWRHFGDSRTNVGVDLRHVRGETRENIAFTADTFTRERRAGGNQSDLGAFVFHDRALTKTLRTTAGARIDAWTEANGHEREIDRASSAVLLDRRHSSTTGAEFNPSLGIVWQPGKAWRWRAHGQRAFRRPTLGERYQSSQEHTVLTAPNPFLRIEHSTSLEVAAAYSLYLKKTSPVFTLETRIFQNELRDTLGTVTVARDSSQLPEWDTLPSAYRAVKRTNLDRARMQGLGLSARWQPSTTLSIEAEVLWNDATMLRTYAYPALGGRQLAETPRRTATLGATWRPARNLSTQLRVRFAGRQFIDSENTLPLGEAIVADLGANYTINSRAELYLNAHNLADARIETGRDLNGLIYLGAPRVVLGGLRLKW